jgi:cell division transport system ATP-binding protein
VASHHLRQLESMVTGRSIVLEKGRLASDTRLDPYKV